MVITGWGGGVVFLQCTEVVNRKMGEGKKKKWEKEMRNRMSVQLGFGIMANGELGEKNMQLLYIRFALLCRLTKP